MFELLAVSKAKTEVARLIVSKIYYMKKLTFTSTNALIPRFSFLRFCFLSLIDFTSYSVFGSSVNDQTGPLLKTSGFFFLKYCFGYHGLPVTPKFGAKFNH